MLTHNYSCKRDQRRTDSTFDRDICRSSDPISKRSCSFRNLEFFLVLSGKCEFLIGDSKNTCTANSVVLVHEQEKYTYTAGADGPINYINLQFEASLLAGRTVARDALRDLEKVHHLTLSDAEASTVQSLFGQIAEESTRQRLNWKIVTINHIETFLVILDRLAERHSLRSETNQAIIHKVIDYLDERYMEKPSLAEVSDRFGFSPYTLSKKFKQFVGLGFKEYLIHRCITHAQRLLEETDNKVATIACEVGFDSISSFNGDFLRLTGVTPSAYRREVSQSPSYAPTVSSLSEKTKCYDNHCF